MHQEQIGDMSNKQIAWILGFLSIKTIYRNKALTINALNHYSFRIPFFCPVISKMYSKQRLERCIFQSVVNITITST